MRSQWHVEEIVAAGNGSSCRRDGKLKIYIIRVGVRLGVVVRSGQAMQARFGGLHSQMGCEGGKLRD